MAVDFPTEFSFTAETTFIIINDLNQYDLLTKYKKICLLLCLVDHLRNNQLTQHEYDQILQFIIMISDSGNYDNCKIFKCFKKTIFHFYILSNDDLLRLGYFDDFIKDFTNDIDIDNTIYDFNVEFSDFII